MALPLPHRRKNLAVDQIAESDRRTSLAVTCRMDSDAPDALPVGQILATQGARMHFDFSLLKPLGGRSMPLV